MDSLSEGKLFNSYREFLEAKSSYEKANYIIIVISHSTKLKSSDSNYERLVYIRLVNFVKQKQKEYITLQQKNLNAHLTCKLLQHPAIPEIIVFDATYKFNNRRMLLFFMMIVDGAGVTEVACLWIIRSESKAATESMLDAFQIHNENWTFI